jgi:ribose transport system ATP-binding protein
MGGQGMTFPTRAETAQAAPAAPTILELENISKSFPGVRALSRVSFALKRGEIRALVGENGAGKSTLIKILSGAYAADEGMVKLFGETVVRPSPAAMIARGVAIIYQELAQAPHLTVAENILLGQLPRRGGIFVDWPQARRLARDIIARLGFDLDPQAIAGDLSVAKRQMVEIAKAISRNARIIVLDEPSAVLADSEIEQLFKLIRRLSADEGVSFIYISHRLKEVFEISDTVTVLRDGAMAGTVETSKTDVNQLIRMMVGRDVSNVFPERRSAIGEPVLSVRNLSTPALLKNISLDLRRGEIVGVCGLAGAGRSELLRAIFGADRLSGGEVSIDGRPARATSPRSALRDRVGLLPEDRKTEGLFLSHSVAFNITIAKLRDILRFHLISRSAETRKTGKLVQSLRIKTPSQRAAVQNLSGGNQQKCVIGKLLNADCRILLADEPTRGVDVGAKREIYDLLFALTQEHGMAILFVSSELPEILNLSDRILVMREGAIAAELAAREASEEIIMKHATVH